MPIHPAPRHTGQSARDGPQCAGPALAVECSTEPARVVRGCAVASENKQNSVLLVERGPVPLAQAAAHSIDRFGTAGPALARRPLAATSTGCSSDHAASSSASVPLGRVSRRFASLTHENPMSLHRAVANVRHGSVNASQRCGAMRFRLHGLRSVTRSAHSVCDSCPSCRVPLLQGDHPVTDTAA